MFLFYRLLLAHIIADFPLQTDEIFNIKTNKKWGVLIHSGIVLVFSVLLTSKYLENNSVLMIILIIFITHTIIDKLKIKYSKKYSNHELLLFLLDQLLHISIIFLLTCNFTQKYLITVNTEFPFLNLLIDIYNNDILIICLIGYLSSIYIIPIFLVFIKEESIENKTIHSIKRNTKNIEITSNELVDKVYRFILTISTQYLNENYILMIFIGFTIANIIPLNINSNKIDRMYNLKRILNTSLAIFIGIILKFVYYPSI